MSQGLEPVRFVKNWNRDTATREENWDEIANKTTAFSLQTNNNLKQISLDLGPDYQFNGVGRVTQSIGILTRLDTLEATIPSIGAQNIGLDVSSQNKIKIVGSNLSNLSASNVGKVSFNSTLVIGEVVTYDLTSNLEVTLTGAHWGNDTYGDLTDYVLWVYLIDTGSAVVLGVGAQGGRQTIASADSSATQTNIVAIDDMLVSTALASTYNCIPIGWVKVDFDDTGNAGGENYWTVQNAVGDINLGHHQTRFEGTVIF